MSDPRDGGLFKVDVPQAFEEIAVFNNSKKCSLSSGDFQRRSYIFCAVVVNGEGFQQRRNCVAIDKDTAAWLRGANDNFLITVRFSDSFVPLVTVLFVVERG